MYCARSWRDVQTSLRVAHVTFSFWPVRGGADAYLAELCRVLDARGCAQTVFQAADPSSAAAPSDFRDLQIVQWPTDRSKSPGRRFWDLTLRVFHDRRLFTGFDRVIAHYPNYALPLVGHPGLIGLSHGVTWDCGPRSAPANRIKRSIAVAAFRNCRAYVANDTLFLSEMGAVGDLSPEAWSQTRPGRWYLPNAVDTRRFRPDSATLVRPMVLVARNLYRNRGVHLALAAFSMLAARWSDHRLRIVGDPGDAGYREELLALTAKLNIEDRVEFAGPTPWAEMPDEYRRSAVSLVPSLCGEGTSLSALESMACGTPVVATRVGGLPDLPCALCEPNPESLAEAIDDVLRHREARAETQRCAVVDGFNLDRWSAAWRQVIETPVLSTE